MGLVPHVMHHIGLVAGAALLTGVVGNSVLYVVGVLFSVPLLRRLQRRFGTWTAPAVGMAVFTALFLLSALVVGPALSPPATQNAPAAQTSQAPPGVDDHSAHHAG